MTVYYCCLLFSGNSLATCNKKLNLNENLRVVPKTVTHVMITSITEENLL